MDLELCESQIYAIDRALLLSLQSSLPALK